VKPVSAENFNELGLSCTKNIILKSQLYIATWTLV